MWPQLSADDGHGWPNEVCFQRRQRPEDRNQLSPLRTFSIISGPFPRSQAHVVFWGILLFRAAADAAPHVGHGSNLEPRDGSVLYAAVFQPDLPTSMRARDHPEHEKYCEFRVRTLMPVDDEAHLMEFVEKQHRGSWHDAYASFRGAIDNDQTITVSDRVGRIVHEDDLDPDDDIDTTDDPDSQVGDSHRA